MKRASRVEVIVGGMYAGKTEELVRRLRRGLLAGKKVAAFKPTIDIRYSKGDIASHSGITFSSYPVQYSNEILDKVRELGEVDLVGVDEVQFFDNDISNVAEILAHEGIRVILAGLDLDYRGEPFGPVPRLLAVADSVTKVTAVCTQCGEDATRSQRIVKSSEQVLVGSLESYEARCRSCWTNA